MRLHSSSKNGNNRFSPPRPIDEYPQDSIKKMAVLFTDIVGSSKFFKSHGDIAGRKMLKKHQGMVSPAINEYGGAVVKFLGDSVMAYFLNPKEALKSAIKVQQRFQHHNERKDPKDQIHIRICVHFGNGIVEESEKDIFGDVVNMAAKFLPLVNGDQVFISQEVFNQVQDLSPIRFEEIDPSEKKKDLLKGLTLYRVLWDESVNLDPITKTLLYLKPLSDLGKDNFSETWDSLLRVKKNHWASKVEKKNILSDKSVALIVKEASSSVDFARDVLEFLRVNLGQDGVRFVPVQIVIDTGAYVIAGKLVLDKLQVNWNEIEPGQIYVSASANELMKNKGSFSTISLPDTNQPQSFYKITLNDEQKGEEYLFLYQNALIQGQNAPCFYCGDRKHLAIDCPSKQITQMTKVLNKFGYLSLDELNTLYLNRLTGNASNIDFGSENHRDTGSSSQWAYYGFFELKSVYQMRLFRTIWNDTNDNWNKIKEKKDDRDKGGLTWIGQDCIRVSNLNQAASILEDALKKDPNDYKAYCALGFLNIEKNDLLQAKYFLKKAQDYTKTTPQKILILFLLSRLYDLNNARDKAERSIRNIIRINPFCAEALYQNILFRFRKGQKAAALQQLVKLIKENREIYIYALIDPELGDFSEIIHPKLKKLLIEAQDEATKIVPEAEKELKKLEKFLGPEEKEVKEARSLCSKIEELSKGESYFAYLDIIHYGKSVVDMGRKSIEVRRRKLAKALRGLEVRLDRCLAFVSNFPYPYILGSVQRQIKHINKEFDKIREMDDPNIPGQFRKVLARVKEHLSQLDQIEFKLKKLDSMGHIILFFTKFFKKSLIFQTINVLIAIIFFPIITHYLSFVLPGLKISPQNIWFFQKSVLVLGGVSGLVLAILSSAKGPVKQ